MRKEEIDYDSVDEFHRDRNEIALSDAEISGSEEEKEVMAIDSDSDYFEKKVENEEEGWGNDKRVYYGEDDVEDIDDAKAEEEEALKLQKKQLTRMDEEDFYVDDHSALLSSGPVDAAVVEEFDMQLNSVKLKRKRIDTSSMTEKKIIAVLEENAPEAVQMWNEIKEYRKELCQSIGKIYEKYFLPNFRTRSLKIKELDPAFSLPLKFVRLKYKSIIAFIKNATFYVYMKALDPNDDLTVHPVVSAVLKCKERLRQLDAFQTENLLQEVECLVDWASQQKADEKIKVQQSVESEESVVSSENELETDNENESDAVMQDAIMNRKREREQFVSYKNARTKLAVAVESNDEESLSSKRKVLDQYAQQNESSRLKRTKREKLAGDDDLPYRQRTASSPIMNADSQPDDAVSEQGEGSGAVDLEEERKRQREEEEKLEEKRFSTEQARQAHQESLAGPDTKRAVSFEILKNKGLTPKRKKELRNPRVKQRNKYAKAQKKIKSQMQVVRDQGGSYGGEETGIRKNLSKSVRFQ